MGKKKKTEETWKCGDCHAELPVSKEWCDAPQHKWAEEVLSLKYTLAHLSENSHRRKYLTAEEFVDALAPMMKDYLIKMYGDDKSHPHDLATAAASFMEAYWIISDHNGI